MTLPEEAMKVATATVGALVSTPALLFMIVLNGLMIVSMILFLNERSSSTEVILKMMFERCLPVLNENAVSPYKR